METQHRTQQPAEVRLTRRYPVGPEKVWRAWTEPQALSSWFGPAGPEAVELVELDVRVGGRYTIRFRTSDGQSNQVSGQYEVVEPLRRLVFSWAWVSTPERVSRVSIALRPVDGGTELDFCHDRFFDETARANHERGWAPAFEKLGAFVTGSAARA